MKNLISLTFLNGKNETKSKNYKPELLKQIARKKIKIDDKQKNKNQLKE